MMRRFFCTALFVITVLPSAWLEGQQESAAPSVTISEPRDGADVGRQIVVKGTARLPEGQKAWLVIRRVDFAPFWWIVAMVRPTPGGQFEVRGTVGEAPDIGSDFDVAVITVNETGHKVVFDHYAATVEQGKFTPIRLPATTSPPRIIKVRKTSHR